ncbi:Katanin p80 wd40 repeat-containing subunit b1-like protein [Forsythia ovata]|uniref:Katanin p80 wd40 repeat-containing subunit b1-like protein n=1 Tax=Forsythia ovata TaxID=205694 RepID=A0ABD1QUC0_9LAMI
MFQLQSVVHLFSLGLEYPFVLTNNLYNTSISLDGKLLTILEGSPECLIADAKSGKVLSNLNGHLDYSFTSAWHPNGQIFATETRNNLLIVVHKVPIRVLRCTQRKDGCNQCHKILIRWLIYGYD